VDFAEDQLSVHLLNENRQAPAETKNNSRLKHCTPGGLILTEIDGQIGQSVQGTNEQQPKLDR
jgi:hypothetical protein